MLSVENLVLRQGTFSLEASFDVPAGARVAVVGASGAGKSTLLNAVAGFLMPVSGRVMWKGKDLTQQPPGARPIAMLFQDNNLFPHLSVAQNVGLGLHPGLRLSGAEQDKVASALARVGLAGFEARKPAELSGGQQSRVALARVLVQRRPLVLLDEPFSALGPALKDEMLDLVRDVADEIGATVLMISHDPEDARRFADLAMFVGDGVAHPPRAVEALFSDPPDALRTYLGSPNG
ncbi:MAG: thiamine ABC transporter ATP-binding protein [Rhodobacterales bacterium]|nr:MAG: thiamine ABC transporter ATP-binding protein [Rhodobacterales bacterium]